MNMGQFKERYERYKQWQRHPMKYVNDVTEVHHCINCGNDFTGNYCSCCSQKAGVGRIGWKSVRQSVMDVWGLGTKSLVYTVWQLLLRPGYLIKDYISGKRQLSFPPVKMLFIVAVIYSLAAYWFFPDVLGIKVNAYEDAGRGFNDLSSWLQSHYSIAELIMAVLAIVPTWVMFRYAPRYPRHTLPEGFFIQIFMAVLIIVTGLLLLPLVFVNNTVMRVATVLVGMFFYIIAYRQLFGYGIWGTLWREGFVILSSGLLITALSLLFFGDDFNPNPDNVSSPGQVGPSKMFVVGFSLALACFFLAIGYAFNLLATRKFRRQLRQEAANEATAAD